MLKPSKQRVFVETSIQIARILSEQDQLEQIEQILANPQMDFVTSQYVYMEYQRTVISDFAHVHRSFHQARSMGEAMSLVFNRSRGFRPRSLLRCGQIVGLIYGEREVVQLSDARSLLHLYLQIFLKKTFWQHVSPLADSIHCDLITNGISIQPNNCYNVANTCRKEFATCYLPDFFKGQSDKLQAISQFLTNNPKVIKDQTRVERLLIRILGDPSTALGQKNCWPLGDIIIALQIPSDCTVWTFDRDFQALTTALGLQLFSVDVSFE